MKRVHVTLKILVRSLHTCSKDRDEGSGLQPLESFDSESPSKSRRSADTCNTVYDLLREKDENSGKLVIGASGSCQTNLNGVSKTG